MWAQLLNSKHEHKKGKTELNPLNKNMRLTPQYKTVIQIRTKNRKEDEKQNTDEYN